MPTVACLFFVAVTLATSSCAPATTPDLPAPVPMRDPPGDAGRPSQDQADRARAPERCDNGVDDDGDLRVDEGCACTPGATQSCHLVAAALASRGACAPGVQTCVADGEFPTWGDCTGAVGPSAEVCDGIDNDCNGAVDDGSGSCAPPPPPPPPPTPEVDAGVCVSGSQTFSEPGTFDFTVPDYHALSVQVWGGGGGGSAYGPIDAPAAGGSSSFRGTVVGAGGAAGLHAYAEAPGGAASGGMTNMPGQAGGGACDAWGVYGVGRCNQGGASPMGGAAVSHVALDGCGALLGGGGGGDGAHGEAPGGGGGGTWTCQGTWWDPRVGGWGMTGGGGGGGGYAAISYSAGQLAPASTIAVVVGAGGRGSRGAVTSGFPGTGRNPGYYTGGDGGAGRVTIAWTCP